MDKKAIFLFLVVGFSLKLFDATAAGTGILKNICFGVMFIAILMSLPCFFKKTGGFVLPVQMICTAIIISIFMAQYSWGQGLSYSPTVIPYAMWFVFFGLFSLNPSIKTIENVVLIYGLIYIVLFLFQFTHNGRVYFGTRELVEDRGVIRVIFPGGGVFFLSCFIAINKVTSGAKYKFAWLGFALVGIVIIVMQVTRQEIAVMLFFYLVHFLRNVKLGYKIAVIALFVAGGYVFINSGLSISKGLVQQQKEDASEGGNYIRIVETEYFLTQFAPNIPGKVLGNGFYNETSNYGKFMISLADNYGYYLSDVGLVEFYIVFGLLAVVGYILIFIKSFTIPVPADYHYLKYYLWMIILTAFTSDFLLSYNFLITTVLVLYCYQSLYEQQKLNKLISSIKLPNEIHSRYTSI